MRSKPFAARQPGRDRPRHAALSNIEGEDIDSAHLPAVLEGLAQAKDRDFATDAEIEAIFRRFD
jgi:hypothetical protein